MLPVNQTNIHFYSRLGTLRGTETAVGVDGPVEDIADVSELYDAWHDFGTAIGWTSDVVFSGIRAEVGTGAGPSRSFTSEGSETGSGSNQLAPSNVSYLVKKLTTDAGRRGRGRMFIPFVREDHVDNAGVLDGEFFTGVQEAVIDFGTAIETITGANLVLFQDGFSDSQPITALVLSSVVATQRRRLVRA